MKLTKQRALGGMLLYVSGSFAGMFAITPGWSWPLYLASVAVGLVGAYFLGAASEP